MSGLNILIYGIDRYTEYIITSIKPQNSIIGISDSFSDLDSFGSIPFIKDINAITFDYIVITARDRGVRDSIIKTIDNKGISKEKIISFFEIFHEDKISKVMRLNMHTKYDGVIIGLSHAAYGINPKYLSGNWVNLATTSEDIYYHNEVLKKCFYLYKRNFDALKYIIIDMYDYSFFSVDTSMSAFALPYWIFGGVPDIHNYNLNFCYGNDIDAELAEKFKEYPAYYPYRKEEELIKRSCVFDEEKVFMSIGKYYSDIGPMGLGYEDFPNEFSNSGHIEKVPKVSAKLLLRSSLNDKRYKKTEKENYIIFKEMIERIKTEAPQTKVILTLIPRYRIIEDIHAENKHMISEKKKFIRIMEEFVDGRTIYYLDLKSEKRISSNYYLWRDEQHVNYQGSIALTSIFDKYLSDL